MALGGVTVELFKLIYLCIYLFYGYSLSSNLQQLSSRPPEMGSCRVVKKKVLFLLAAAPL